MEQAHLTGRLGRPEEVIWFVVFLASDEASFMNGSVVTVMAVIPVFKVHLKLGWKVNSRMNKRV